MGFHPTDDEPVDGLRVGLGPKGGVGGFGHLRGPIRPGDGHPLLLGYGFDERV